jgi:ribonuclease III
VTGLARWAETVLGYRFTDPRLLELALTHRSASRDNNERLEFLGDAMLSFSIAALLYAEQPAASEGDLSRARAALVNRRTLARIGRVIGIDNQLRLGAGELSSGGAQRESALADAVEAVIGAVVQDGGEGEADRLIRRLFADEFRALPPADALKDAKTRLQEWLQARGLGLPGYAVDGVSGKDHNQQFAVTCTVAALNRAASGQGTSRRRAEQAAAESMLIELQGADG